MRPTHSQAEAARQARILAKPNSSKEKKHDAASYLSRYVGPRK